jgi:eukaryotic-like serine/threonine-protein kinase
MKVAQNIAGYRVLAHIGSGAASELYCVQDTRTKQIWALKHVKRESEKDQRFLDQVVYEYNVASKLDHPNIRRVHRLIRHRKFFKVTEISLIMELVDAQTLDQMPGPPGERTMGDMIRIFEQVALGLHHMHTRGFVHADIKPNNILVSESGQVKIIDLGQACPIGTEKKRIQGTPGYMAPEQAHRRAITPATDIYNFGAMIYWVLTRDVIPTVLPPKDESGSLHTGTLDADMVKPPEPPHKRNPAVPPLLSKVILDCVQLDIDDRPESMELVAKRLGMIGDLLDAQSTGASAVAGKDAAEG